MSVFADNEVFELIRLTKIADILPSGKAPVVALTAEHSAKEAINTMAQNKVLSVPILDDEQLPIAFVSQMDIIRYVIDQVGNKDEIKESELEAVDLDSITTRDIIDFHSGKPFATIYEFNPLPYIVELFVGSGLHRIMLYKAVSKEEPSAVIPSTVCSQSDVVHFLADSIEQKEISNFAQTSLEGGGIKRKPVHKVGSHSTVLEAIRLMGVHNVQGLAVVDPHGKLIGNFSASDIRGLAHSNFGVLLEPVEIYLQNHSPNSLKPVTVELKDTFASLIGMVSTGRLHRVWLVDKDHKPVGVVTLTDILRAAQSFRDRPKASLDDRKTTLPLPGKLTIQVKKATDLPKGGFLGTRAPTTFVEVKFEGHEVKRTKVVKADINPEFNELFQYDISNKDLLSSLRFQVLRGDDTRSGREEIGSYSLKMAWIADGFGTANSAVRGYEESFKLHGSDQGELLISMAFESEQS